MPAQLELHQVSYQHTQYAEAAHQTLSAIENGGNVSKAYRYTLGKRWGQYNVEQQASIVEDWFRKGRKTTDPRYRYIRDNIRKGKVN